MQWSQASVIAKEEKRQSTTFCFDVEDKLIYTMKSKEWQEAGGETLRTY